MEVKKLNRTFFQRVLGRPATELPENNDFWSVDDGKITIDLSQAPALAKPAGAVRLEGDLLAKVLVVHGEDGQYRAYENKCTHMGRRIDPVPGTETVQCCSVNCATFDHDGNKIAGPAKKTLKTYPVKAEDGKLVIEIG